MTVDQVSLEYAGSNRTVHLMKTLARVGLTT